MVVCIMLSQLCKLNHYSTLCVLCSSPIFSGVRVTWSLVLCSSPVFSGVRVTRSLVLCVMFCRSLFVPFGHCIVCPPIYRLPLWYLQTLLPTWYRQLYEHNIHTCTCILCSTKCTYMLFKQPDNTQWKIYTYRLNGTLTQDKKLYK